MHEQSSRSLRKAQRDLAAACRLEVRPQVDFERSVVTFGRALGQVRVKMLLVERGSPSEDGYNESFSGKVRDELLNLEIF